MEQIFALFVLQIVFSAQIQLNAQAAIWEFMIWSIMIVNVKELTTFMILS